MNKNDLRFIRTEENLKNALLELLETSPVSAVSITQICHQAGCSRNAFYQHHETKEELYDLIMKDTVQTIQSSCLAMTDDPAKMDEVLIEKYNHRLLEVIDTRRKEITAFLKSSSAFSDVLCNSLYETMIEQDLRITGKEDLDPQTKLMTMYICSGITAFIRQWLIENPLPLSEAQKTLDQCTRDIMRRTADRLYIE